MASDFNSLYEVRPAWPGFDKILHGRYEQAQVRKITMEKFASLLASQISNVGYWESPAGPARIFYIGTDSATAVAVTVRGDLEYFQLTPGAVIASPRTRSERRRLE